MTVMSRIVSVSVLRFRFPPSSSSSRFPSFSFGSPLSLPSSVLPSFRPPSPFCELVDCVNLSPASFHSSSFPVLHLRSPSFVILVLCFLLPTFRSVLDALHQ